MGRGGLRVKMQNRPPLGVVQLLSCESQSGSILLHSQLERISFKLITHDHFSVLKQIIFELPFSFPHQRVSYTRQEVQTLTQIFPLPFRTL